MATELDDARYISLMSFKRDGTGVPTPVWTAPLDGKLVVFTSSDSYKVKRIRRNPELRVARCDMRGRLLGRWLEGTCAVVQDKAHQERIMEALTQKYGWQLRLLNVFAALGRRIGRRAYLEITVKTDA
jgi:PPOX class probable F420-dependent enzyme